MNNYTPEQIDRFFEEFKKFVDNPEYKLRIIGIRDYIDEKYPRRDLVGLNARVRYIEECLGVDFNLDREKRVEYAFIQDKQLREKIMAYYREMLRYEYATRNHKRCFGEFCRLAVIQVELLLNYFYTKKILLLANYDYEKALQDWRCRGMRGPAPQKKSYEDKYQSNPEEIVLKKNLSEKSKLFCNSYFNKKFINYNSIASISIWTSSMRNRKSHGSKASIEPYENDYFSEEDKRNLEKYEARIKELIEEHNEEYDVDIKFEDNRIIADKDVWNNIMSQELRDLYNNKYQPLQWVFKEPFKDVHDFLRIIAATCAKELGNR